MNHPPFPGNSPVMKPTKTRAGIALIAIAATIQGCSAGSGEGLNVSGRPLSESGDVPLAATLESIQVNVFDASCTSCHAGAAAPLGLQLDAGNSYVNLVGVSSRQVGSLLRVAPGDPDARYRMLVFHGNAGYALNRDYFVTGLRALGSQWDVFLFEYPGYGAREGR